MSTDLEIKLQMRLDEIMQDYEQSLACQRKYLQHVTESKQMIRDLEAQLSEVQIAQAIANKKYEKVPFLLSWTCLRCWFCSCLKRVYPD